MTIQRTTQFIVPFEARCQYGDIIPAYQAAFAGEPWFEVSKCASCESGFSAQSPGDMCEVCGNKTGGEAYTETELTDRFDDIGETRPTSWYTERDALGRLTLAAVAWLGTPERVSEERYSGDAAMSRWLNGNLPSEFVWLDEVFANRANSPSGNLANFRPMIDGMAERIGKSVVAYRTITPAMTRAALRDFSMAATVNQARRDVPDRRNFVTINLEK